MENSNINKIQSLHLTDLQFNQRLETLNHWPNYDMVGAFTKRHTLKFARQPRSIESGGGQGCITGGQIGTILKPGQGALECPQGGGQ